MTRFRLTIEYQGTRYHGWQGQKNARTVQGELMRAAADLLGAAVEVQGAGRTDAGVHALAQVAHLDAPIAVREEDLAWRLNERLPADINVLRAEKAHHRFHARHHALGRSYLYQISRRRTAFGKPFVWWVKDRLDARAMARAAALFIGMHDFGNFADKRMEKEASTLVRVEEVVVVEAGDLILVRLRASHFLWKMVRRLTGCLVEVGRGALGEKQLLTFLEVPSGFPAEVTAPPSGLFLEEIVYEGGTWRRPLEPVIALPAL